MEIFRLLRAFHPLEWWMFYSPSSKQHELDGVIKIILATVVHCRAWDVGIAYLRDVIFTRVDWQIVVYIVKSKLSWENVIGKGEKNFLKVFRLTVYRAVLLVVASNCSNRLTVTWNLYEKVLVKMLYCNESAVKAHFSLWTILNIYLNVSNVYSISLVISILRIKLNS